MAEGAGYRTEREPRLPASGNWRAVVSAWVIVIVALLALAAYQALASHRDVSPRAASLAGVVIPQHDPTCSGPRVPDATAGEGCGGLAAPYGQVPAYSGW